MQKRKSVKKLQGRKIGTLRECPANTQYVEFLSPAGKIIFTVHRDQIFDEHGDHFEIDL